MGIKRKIIILLTLLPLTLTARTVDLYEQYYAICAIKNTGVQVIALRKFRHNGNNLILTIHPVTLQTAIYSSDSLAMVPADMQKIRETFRGTPYCRLLSYSESRGKKLLNAGITHFSPQDRKTYLTVDLCPSRHPLDRKLFTEVIQQFTTAGRPVPMAVAVTGLWMEKHEDDIIWLRRMERDGKIAITWIDHTYNHRSRKETPLRKNFLLADKSRIEEEILKTEKAMIERDMRPSVFFRFPGLTSDLRLFNKITGFGLIPIGTDAWLAKNQWPRNGSIILVHGNGNEPVGIRKFLGLMKKKKMDIESRNWALYDLREGARDLGREIR